MTAAAQQALPFVPLIIIGAGRSGTNALRDALVRIEGFATWPCDEINPIWRHGNLNHPNDEIPAEKASPKTRVYIRNAFCQIWNQQGRPKYVVEKTCANALRVPFVDAVLPEARYIHIVRDGYDVLSSAQKRWRGELEMPGLPYFLAKARYAPLSDLPSYALSAIWNRVMVRLGRKARLDQWGPQYDGMEDYRAAPLDEIVARQWAACVLRSDAAFSKIDPTRVFQIRYEDFIAAPIDKLAQTTKWLGIEVSSGSLANAAAIVRHGSVGKGRGDLAARSYTVKNVLKSPLAAHGYLD